MNTKNKVLLGVLGAAAAGVVIGLLIAPEKGSEMRQKIKKTAGDWADNLTHLFMEGKEGADEVKDKLRTSKSSVEEKVNKVRDSFS
jgi:gas vesicle protein